MEKPSYQKKLDHRLPVLLEICLVNLEELDVCNERGVTLSPEFYEKYVKEGCPDWTKMYGSKINMHKIISLVKEAFPIEFAQELKQIEHLDWDEKVQRIFEVGEKHDEEFIQSLLEGFKRKKITVLLSCYVIKHIFLFPALFGESLSQLLKKASKGDHEAILKLIQVDKSFIGTKWSMKEIRKAQMSGNFEFLDKVGNSIKKDSWSKNKRKNLYLSFVLVFGWELGLKKLKNSEIHDLVTDLGVYEHEDTESLYKEIKRLKLKKEKRQKKIA